MDKGYMIVEPERVNPFMVYKKYHEYAVAVLYWLREELYKEMKAELDGIEIDVIKVEYFGAYPALGLHFEDPSRADYNFGQRVELTAEKIMREKPVSDLIQFMASNDINWNEVARKVME